MPLSCYASGSGSSSISTKRDRDRVGLVVVWIAGGSSSWDKDGMSLPKYIIPKISSSRSGSFFLSERVLEHILVPEEGSIH